VSGPENPLQFPTASDSVYISGPNGTAYSPGVIPPNGIQGFDRKSGWQIKKGKGSVGATFTFVQAPPAKGKVIFHLASVQDFYNWDTFRLLLLYQPAKKSDQANFIYHPALDDLNISQVVTESISPWRHLGKGLFQIEVEFIEWTVVPQVNITQTPTSAGSGGFSPPPLPGLLPGDNYTPAEQTSGRPQPSQNAGQNNNTCVEQLTSEVQDQSSPPG
jgi:hypothetical protein